MYQQLFASLVTVIVVLFLFCTTTENSADLSGQLDIRVWIDPTPASGPAARKTLWNNLIVRVESEEGEEMESVIPVDPALPFSSVELNSMKTGVRQYIAMMTKDSDSVIIHGPAYDTVTLVAGETVVMNATLDPVRGSMYLFLTGFSSDIDTVLFAFVNSTDTFSVRLKKSTKLYASLDRIAYGTVADIHIRGYGQDGTEKLSWVREGYLFTKANTTLDADFLNESDLEISVTIAEPGVTVIFGKMNGSDSAETETLTGDSVVLITEIMASGGSGDISADYIELYNPSITYDSLWFDTLLVDLSGVRYVIADVGIRSGSFFTFGGGGITDSVKWNIDRKVEGFDLVSTTESIMIKNSKGKLIDRVWYVMSEDVFGWPKVSSSAKTSVALDSIHTSISPEANNYGSRWKKCSSSIHPDLATWKGTPGRDGL